MEDFPWSTTTSSPSTSGHTLCLSIHSASLTIKVEKKKPVPMALGTYCEPTPLYRIIWLKISTSLCHAIVPQGKHTFRSTCCEFLPPVEQTRCMVIYHINCIPTEDTYCIFSFLRYPEQTRNGSKEQTLTQPRTHLTQCSQLYPGPKSVSNFLR